MDFCSLSLLYGMAVVYPIMHSKSQCCCRLLIMLSIRRQCIIFMDKLCRLQATRKTKRKKTRPVILPKNEKQCKKRERDRSSYFWDPLLLFTLTKTECVNIQWSFHYCTNLSQKTVILDQKLFIGNYEAIKRVATSIDKPIFLHIWEDKSSP